MSIASDFTSNLVMISFGIISELDNAYTKKEQCLLCHVWNYVTVVKRKMKSKVAE